MRHIHFVGVSGIGVSAVARLAIDSNVKVSGSADEENEQTKRLMSRGMDFFLGHREGQIGQPDFVVRSAAVPLENPELQEAQRRRIPVYLYSEYLGMLMSEKQGIAVAGTHGKTTTTALITLMLSNAGLKPTAVCGGVMENFSSNALSGDGNLFVAEACEYNRSFLHLHKWYALVTNIEPEHLDCYSDIHDIREAFGKFLDTTDPRGVSVVNGDDKNIRLIIRTLKEKSIITVGYGRENDYSITNRRADWGFYSFDLVRENKTVLNVRLRIPGSFNCINAALSSVLALRLGVKNEIVRQSILTFKGTKRRLECLGTVDENPVYSDYAHHPTEINSSISTLLERHPSRKILLIFQPHQYSRTKAFFQEFAKELQSSDYLLLTDIYRQRDSEKDINGMKGSALFEALKSRMGKRVSYIERTSDILPYLENKGYQNVVIVFMGAGDIDGKAREYVEKYGAVSCHS